MIYSEKDFELIKKNYEDKLKKKVKQVRRAIRDCENQARKKQ